MTIENDFPNMNGPSYRLVKECTKCATSWAIEFDCKECVYEEYEDVKKPRPVPVIRKSAADEQADHNYWSFGQHEKAINSLVD